LREGRADLKVGRYISMKRVALAAIFIVVAGVRADLQVGSQYKESDFLTRIRRLTVEGRRAGEGYWSPDGKKIVFQSEREAGNPFYQIYTLDLTTGDTMRISPGYGKTTCSFFRPRTDEIEFASTHHDPQSKKLQQDELDFRASGKTRRYSWDYDPEFDIYSYKPGKNGGAPTYTRLTNARGYDAEGSYSPDGQWIVFTSMRDAYNRMLSAEEKKQLEIDPSYFAEIYIMHADGTGQTRLTNVPGYDGGPFFSPDGKRIIYRSDRNANDLLQLYVNNPEGTAERQLTSNEFVNWGPFWHPDSTHIVYSTSRHGHSNYEVYLMNVDSGAETRITYHDGFDGLPVISPDGKKLMWTSNSRGTDRNSQLFIADFTLDPAPRTASAP
jgi:Tol biopolymer transport system component